ncbi:hypothetical protein FA10DRAFT_263665 [Acaromyces ingoldii]|uniref:Uncharacterized protein n=1 Tax=Acaromyces ingoldii TaxID=215250 RepID=A0A316YW96_9BASI|nr:hypothetical protein FA10DRAFT_263665 [Acaromyces ingoldii]PWN92938.1 hypothetical protein FA10DRAFT_263665 [Acaromyces ingoldii]
MDTRGKRIRTAGHEGVTDITFRLTCGSLHTSFGCKPCGRGPSKHGGARRDW